MSRGWRQIYGARGQLVTGGVYEFVRHPQYTGLFLVIAGFLIQWPTFLTVIMAPILFYAYYRLSLHEEKVMHKQFGDEYKAYASGKPMFFPAMSKWSDFLSATGNKKLPKKSDHPGI